MAGAYLSLTLRGVCVAATFAFGGCALTSQCDEDWLADESRHCSALPGDHAWPATPIQIDAQRPYNCTGLALKKGERFQITVSNVQNWRDSIIRADVDEGWPAFFYRWLWGDYAQRKARHPKAPMYSLLGAYGDRRDTYFRIGRGGIFTASEDGQLLVFANDWNHRYCNNRGTTEITVERLR